MTDHVLLKPFIDNGDEKAPGDTVSLTDDLADWLDGIGVISKSGAPKPMPKVMLTPKQPPPRKRCCGW